MRLDPSQFWALHPDAIGARVDVSPVMPVDGLAFMSIVGPVQRDAHPTAPSWAAVREFIATSKADPLIKGVAFLADSGGGAVAGMQSAAYAIRSLGKPSMMVVPDGGVCGSAVFYVGQACSLGIFAAPLSMVGGVGVYIPMDPDPIDPAVVSSLTPAKHLSDSDPRAQAGAQQAADDLAAVMLTDLAAWRGLSGPDEAARFYGEGAMVVASRAAAAGMIAGCHLEPPFHLFNPAGPPPAIPGGAPMPGANARAEAEGLNPEALAESVAEVEAEAEPDFAAMTPEERAALIDELQAKIAAIKAADAPAPDMSKQAAAFSAGLVAKGHVLPRDRATWERDFIADPGGTAVKALALKPALHTVAKGDARREPAPAMAMTGTSASAKAKAYAKEKGLTYSHAVSVLSADPAFKAAIMGA